MVYTRDLKSLAFTGLRVRAPSPVHKKKTRCYCSIGSSFLSVTRLFAPDAVGFVAPAMVWLV